ncbi:MULTISPECIES: fused MFS/spermidine synthase [Agromyces]|uniref:Fused MFS/spermidine synthase n=1 Tax=Agromyces indicus TaxID=758919 RepID=A0ABU1FLG3_9MICO|nr:MULTISPECIES: fused MFS/spermidine synthase [Agromyces]MCK8609161.1 fused MFS/spermidine synthase [Agromyces sp. C10]MDR5692590.1 fused MFS/spermidine synthase [Agromyces indicus]
MASRIEFERDVFSPTGLTLLVDGAAQSHVDAADPTRLFFEYVRRIGHVVDAIADPGAPIAVLHLGGGAMSLARYVEATRPDSTQVVVEADPRVVELVAERMPLPGQARIDVVVADARDAVARLAADGARFDLVIVDLYTRLDAPAFVDGPEFLGACLERLAPGGVLVVNVADAAGGTRLAAQARAVARADPAAALLVAGDPAVLSGAEEGNAVLVAGPSMPERVRERLRDAGPFPAELLEGARLDVVLWGAC